MDPLHSFDQKNPKKPWSEGISLCLYAKISLLLQVKLIYHVNSVADIITAALVPAETAHMQQGDGFSHFSLLGESSVED